MSSVGSSDRSNDEKVRQNREEYLSRESELIKKHQRELRRLAEVHNKELMDQRAAHSSQLGEVQNRHRETVSRRDMKHRKEAEDLRAMNRKQQEKMALENQKKMENTKRSTRSELEAMRTKTDGRIETMQAEHSRTVGEKDRTYAENLNEIRESSQTQLSDRFEKIRKRQAAELEALNKTRVEELSQLQREYSEYRRSTDNKIDSQELRHMVDKRRMSNNAMRQVEMERESAQVQSEILRDGFESGLAKMRDRYGKKIKEDQQIREGGARDFRGKVQARIDSRVGSLEDKLERSQHKNVLALSKKEMQNKEQIQNVKDSYQKNIENLEDQRAQLVHASNKQNSKAINEIHERNQKLMTHQNRFYLSKIADNKRLTDEQKQVVESNLGQRLAHSEVRADTRINQIVNSTNIEKERLTQFVADTKEALQLEKQEEMKELRATYEKKMAQTLENSKKQIQKNELQNEKRMSQVTTRYESKLAKLQDQLTKTKREGAAELKRVTNELTRNHQFQMETQNARAKSQVAKLEEKHGAEKASLNDRHEAKVDQLLGTLKRT